MAGVKCGNATFDVKLHAVLFDREIEQAIADHDACPRRDALLPQGIVQTKFQRTVDTGRVDPRAEPRHSGRCTLP